MAAREVERGVGPRDVGEMVFRRWVLFCQGFLMR